MAQNFASNIASAPMDDSLMASFIFKSIEIGTLKPENVMATLERHGITLSIKRDYFYMDSSRNQDFNLAENHIFNNDFDSNNDNVYNNNNSNNNNNNNNTKKNSYKKSNKNNHNNINSAEFADFIANPSKAWATNVPDPAEKDTNVNVNLLSSYLKLLGVTSSSTKLKRLPKFITYGNAKSHLNDIFIPRIVCLSFLFLFLSPSQYFLIFLDRTTIWLI
jgi:hypothetical protein